MALQFALMFLSDWSGSTIYSGPPQATKPKGRVSDFENTFRRQWGFSLMVTRTCAGLSPLTPSLPPHSPQVKSNGCVYEVVDGLAGWWNLPQARFAGWSRSSPCAQKYQQQHFHIHQLSSTSPMSSSLIGNHCLKETVFYVGFHKALFLLFSVGRLL